ncbi:putative fructosyl amino acid protein [Halenospora varia]|nr:putative fructosyl amino acid protein [Halenospora varia]
MSPPSSPSPFPPKTILIIGSGVFGLSTALSLSTRSAYASSKITLIDRSTFPTPDGSSIDTSRIIRPDYADPAYAALAAAAQEKWRQQGPDQLGGSGRYTQSGLIVTANKGQTGEHYVRESFSNVSRINKNTPSEGTAQELPSKQAIEQRFGGGGGSGDWGYINTRSGWADAEAGMRFLRLQVEGTRRVKFLTDEVTRLIFSKSKDKVTGVQLKSNTTLIADLVILATGAWTPSLIDLRGRAQATGQVLAYMPITDSEQEKLGKNPVLLNMSTGMFIIPPANNLLKVARHGYGYSNPVSIPHPEDPSKPNITVSRPWTHTTDPSLWIPREGEAACQQALAEMIPPSPTDHFIITYHPSYSNLFLATGGSGHGYKFLPVIGEKIVDCVEGRCPDEFREKWAWRKEAITNVVTEDGSRGGRPGMVLEEEMRRGQGSKL